MRVSLFQACVLCALTTAVWGLHLGAFNAHVFGPTKAGKQDVMGILAKIAARYDILLVQEIKDISGEAIQKLIQRIKEDHGITMSINISDRLGRTSSKEQYAFLFRQDRGLSVIDSFHFDDGNETAGDDLFQREPYVIRFRASRCMVTDFTLIALHTMPSETVEELKALTQVVQFVRKTWRTENMMVLGDLNADCSYVPKKSWPEIQLRHDSDFWWAIGDNVDTTVNANTDCAYDRFVIGGRKLKNAVIARTVQAFDFQTRYGLSSEQALAVSDHYPIELTLQDQQQSVSTEPTNNRASGATSLMETLQQAWRVVVKRFSRWRSDSDL